MNLTSNGQLKLKRLLFNDGFDLHILVECNQIHSNLFTGKTTEIDDCCIPLQ